MRNNIRSYNTRLTTVLGQLVPNGAQVFLDIIIALLLLAAFNVRGIWYFFTTGITADSQVDLGSLIDEKTPALQTILDNLAHGRFIQILFWLFVGCIVYILIWLVGNFFTNIRNDIIADEYVHPRFYNRAGYWGSIFSRKIIFASITMVLAAFLYAGLKLTAALANLCYYALKDFEILVSSFELLGSLLAVATLVQIFFMLTKIAINCWQLIYKDL